LSALTSATTWSVGLWRLASGRIRADWRFLVGVWLLLACATTLLASGVIYGDAVAVGSLRAAVRAAPLAAQGVTVESTLTAAQIAGADDAVRAALTTMLGRPGGTVGLELRSGSLVPIGAAATTPAGSATPSLTALESADSVSDHATLVTGSWPVAGRTPIEAALSEGAARAFGLTVGGKASFADASTPGADQAKPIASVTIVGIYRPDPTDPAWSGDELDLLGSGTVNGVAYRGPFLVDRADLAILPGRFDSQWRAVPDLDRLSADDIAPLTARLDDLPGTIRTTFPPGGTANVTLQLGQQLDAIAQSLNVARGAVLLLTLQFAVVAAYAVLLVSGMLADRRRPEIGLLRSRGASTGHVAALAFGEAVLLALPAVVVAPFAAVGLVRLLGQVGPLAATGAVAAASPSPTALVAIAVTGLVAAIALALPALTSGAEVAGIRALLGRPVARTLAQRLGIDVALLAVAGVAIWQLRSYGQPLTRDVHGVLGIDPLLAAAPAFGLVAGGVVATRLVPRLGEVGERLLSRLRGLVSPLMARQVARRPLRYTRAVLLLILASALGTFGAIYATTWSTSHASQAAYQAGADVRVVPGAAALGSWSVGPTYRALPGVVAALPLGRSPLSVGTVVRNGTLLATDAKTAASIMTLPPGEEAALSAALGTLAAARPTALAVALPTGTTAIRVHLDAALTEPPVQFSDTQTIELPSDYRGINITADVLDADGVITQFTSPQTEQGLFAGRDQTLGVSIGDSTEPAAQPAEPRVLIGLELVLTNAFGQFLSPISGSLTITGIDGGTGTAASWTPLAIDAARGWSWEESDGGALTTLSNGLVGKIPAPADDTQPNLGDVSMRFVPPQPQSDAIPAIAGSQLLAVTGSKVGDTLSAGAAGEDVTMKVIGQVTEFPTVQPDVPFAIVDGPTLALVSYLEGTGTGNVTEWWLSTRPGASTEVATAVAAAGIRTSSIVDRAAVLAALESDPVGLGTLGALLLGSLAAAAFAVVGFLVGASVAARERVGEFALLRALGLSGGQLTRWLATENAFLLALGVLAGTGIGVLLGWLIVPVTLLGSTGAPVVPTPTLEIPWDLIALVYAGAVLLLVATVAVVGRPLPGRTVAVVLRAAEE